MPLIPFSLDDTAIRGERAVVDLKGMKAVVIGGTSGIGRALALGLARSGADVAASSRSQESVDKIAAEIEAYGVGSMRISCDVSDRQSLLALRNSVLQQWGVIDILINSAGMTKRVPSLEIDEALWSQIFEVNLTGVLRACQVFGEPMIARGFGRIINIASLSSFVAFHEVAPYGASKAAVAALTRSLAVEWASSGVTVNAIAPGIIPTALNRKILDSPRGHELLMRTPMGRYGEAEELVSTAVYLASRETSFTTGQIVIVDGGILASGVNQ
ncbi:MAG: SDR family oxidoreductase [Edaphobacter sp.]|uniref:SDR family NAD(P)-dependent oxidoreductase n=1 Tax=Edaphobacter sp. TaxID=1934404 RepID=UPI002390B555|nr:SDR family oxidoreductase [Edaphobacter sp.]MDE1175565.1 SDR family oxidoreductase [Edaphobacter sp.]